MYSQAKMVHSTTPHHTSLQLNFNTHYEPIPSFFSTITHLTDNIKIMQFSILLMSGALMLISTTLMQNAIFNFSVICITVDERGFVFNPASVMATSRMKIELDFYSLINIYPALLAGESVICLIVTTS